MGDDGRPIIRIELAYFKRFAYSPRAAREIDALRTLNPEDQARRWDNFDWLYSVDPQAAVKATSWGAFQIMGFNHESCGFEDPLMFLEAMRQGGGAQVSAFVRFVESGPALLAAMRAASFADVARHYNGPAYARNQYDAKLRQAVARFSGGRNA